MVVAVRVSMTTLRGHTQTIALATADPNVTRLLRESRDGNRHAATELMPLIYDELRSLAMRHMRSERVGHTVQATSLVHEAFVKLAGSHGAPWQDRAHFFAAAATLIRQILVQHARARNAEKRGGKMQRASVDVEQIAEERSSDELLAVDEALRKLADMDPGKARLVELRFFAGLSAEETAEALGMSPRSMARQWAMARAWLSRELTTELPDE